MLKKLHISSLKKGFIDAIAPTTESLEVALKGLRFLGALDKNDNLSSDGEIMCEVPLDVQMTRTLLASVTFNCSNEIISISAMLSGMSTISDHQVHFNVLHLRLFFLYSLYLCVKCHGCMLPMNTCNVKTQCLT